MQKINISYESDGFYLVTIHHDEIFILQMEIEIKAFALWIRNFEGFENKHFEKAQNLKMDVTDVIDLENILGDGMLKNYLFSYVKDLLSLK